MPQYNQPLELSTRQTRWIFVGLGLVFNLCLGSIYSWSVFRIPLEKLFQIGATQTGIPFTVVLVFFAGLMPIAGGLIEKYGPRNLAIIGGTLVGLGWFLAGFANNILLVSICFGIIAGSGVGIAYGVPISVVTKWFPDKKGLAVGITLIGFGLSPLFTAPIARWLIHQYGPLQTFSILGITFFIILILLSLAFRFPPAQWQQQSKLVNQSRLVNTQADISVANMVTSSRFYGLWFCYIIGTFSGLMAIGISSPVGQEIIQLSPDTAAFFISIFAIFNGIGRPLFGWLTDKITPRLTAIISFIIILCSSLGMLITATAPSAIVYLFCFSGFWLTLGGWLATAPAATAIFFGTFDYAKKYGIVYTAYGIGAIFGNLLSGRLRDIFGSYLYVFYPTAFLAIIGIFIAYCLLKPPKYLPVKDTNG